jgi:hypothetical protein
MAQRSRGSMALQALQNAATGLSSVASAAMAACRPQGAVTTEEPTSTGAPHNLSDFGIQDDLRLGDPLLPDYGYEPFSNQDSNSHHHRNSDFVFLEHFRLMPKREGYGAVANLDLFFSVRSTNGKMALFAHARLPLFLVVANKRVSRLSTIFIITED